MIVVDWNSREIRIVAGKIRRKTAVLSAAVRCPLPADHEAGNAAALGAAIRSALQAAKIDDDQAAFCVDRRSVVLKQVPLPDVAAADVHEFLRLQALRDLTIPIENAVIDFLQTRPGDHSPQGQAILAVLQKADLDFRREVAKAAGLELLHLWPASLARAEAARPFLAHLRRDRVDEAPGQAVAVVDDRDVELILLREGHLLASVARPIVGDDFLSGLSAAVRRAAATMATQLQENPIAALLYAGVQLDAAQVEVSFGDFRAATIEGFDPLTELPDGTLVDLVGPATGTEQLQAEGPQRRLERAALAGNFAASLGGFFLTARPAAQQIDFINPKKPAPRVDLRRPLALVCVGVALACGLQGRRYYQGQRAVFDAAIEKSKADESMLAKQLATLRPRQEQAETIAAWRKQDMGELDVLDRLFAIVASEPKASLAAVSIAPAVRRDVHSATLAVEGLADSQTTVAELLKRLGRDGGFEVKPGPVQPSGRAGGPTLWRFSIELLAPNSLRKQGKPA